MGLPSLVLPENRTRRPTPRYTPRTPRRTRCFDASRSLTLLQCQSVIIAGLPGANPKEAPRAENVGPSIQRVAESAACLGVAQHARARERPVLIAGRCQPGGLSIQHEQCARICYRCLACPRSDRHLTVRNADDKIG